MSRYPGTTEGTEALNMFAKCVEQLWSKDMGGTPQAFTDEEALAVKGDKQKQAVFIADLVARGVWQGIRTISVLEDLWDVGPDYLRMQLATARILVHAALDGDPGRLRERVHASFDRIETEALKRYEAIHDKDSRTAQKYLETALAAGKALQTLLPKAERDEDDEVVLRVELSSAERPKNACSEDG